MIPERHAASRGLARVVVALVLFGLSFGFIEAAVVVYLRAVYEPLHERLFPGRAPGDLFPIIRIDQLEDAGPSYRRLLEIELVREAATLVLLASVSAAAGRSFREGFAAFVVAFGLWDLSFYGSLKVLIDWPSSVWTWDLLFLLPVPWVGPVLAPMIVAASMIGAGLLVLAREARGRPVPLAAGHWATIVAGGLVVVVAFCWDWRNIAAGGRPNPFPWPLFAVGEVIGLGGFGYALRRDHSESIAAPSYNPVQGTSETPAR